MHAEALHQLNTLIRAPANAMVLLSEPTWKSEEQGSRDQSAQEPTLFAVANWLDESINEDAAVPELVFIELKRLAFATMECVRFPT